MPAHSHAAAPRRRRCQGLAQIVEKDSRWKPSPPWGGASNHRDPHVASLRWTGRRGAGAPIQNQQL
jgi:hypothetical protein